MKLRVADRFEPSEKSCPETNQRTLHFLALVGEQRSWIVKGNFLLAWPTTARHTAMATTAYAAAAAAATCIDSSSIGK